MTARATGVIVVGGGRSAADVAREQVEYLTPPTLASLLGVQVSTLAKWRWAGSGPPFVTLGPTRILYVRRDVDEWLAQRRVRSTADAQARGLSVAPTNKGCARPR